MKKVLTSLSSGPYMYVYMYTYMYTYMYMFMFMCNPLVLGIYDPYHCRNVVT